MTPQETDPDLPMSVHRGVSSGGMGQKMACCRVGGTVCSSACMGPFEGGAIIFITSTIAWPQVK